MKTQTRAEMGCVQSVFRRQRVRAAVVLVVAASVAAAALILVGAIALAAFGWF